MTVACPACEGAGERGCAACASSGCVGTEERSCSSCLGDGTHYCEACLGTGEVGVTHIVPALACACGEHRVVLPPDGLVAWVSAHAGCGVRA